MSTPTAEAGGAPGQRGLWPVDALVQASELARRGWYWGRDYAWVTRGFVDGLVRSEVPAGFAEGDRSPVLLLPGVVEEWTMMRLVAERLNREGHPVHVVPQLGRSTMAVPDGSAVVTAHLAARNLRDVVVVAHSKGGLIGKHVLTRDADSRIRRLVAIATPFAGSVLARWFPWSTVRALRPADSTIIGLQAATEVNHLITSIYPAFDPHIPGGSHLEGATNVPVAAMGHFRVLGDAEVLDAVAAAAAKP